MSHQIKIILLGDPTVGKTSLITRFFHNTFTPHHKITKSVDSCSFTLQDEWEVVVWDTAGQECFKSLNRLYYRDVKVVMLVHDCSTGSGTQSMDAWLQEFIDSTGCSQHTGNSTDAE